MPISGPVVHQQLMDAYARVQADLEKERGQLSANGDQRDELLNQRSGTLVELAQHYLPELTPEAVHETWAEVRPSLHKILLRRETQCDQLKAELQQWIADRHDHEQVLVSIGAELDSAIGQQDEVASEVEAKLQEDAGFVRLSDRAAVAEAALERAEANLQEIEQDSERKLPAYDDSTLFRYLHDREFGTAQYKSRGFTRRMDRWVAKMVNYHKAKQGYDFLRETPGRMRQIIGEDRTAFDVVMSDLERQRDVVAEALDLPQRIALVDQLREKRKESLSKIDALLAQCNEQQIKLNEIEDSRGPHYQEAIGMFRDLLSRVDTRDLQREAKQTIEITDDQIVAQLRGVETEIDQFDDASERRRERLARHQSFLEELGRVLQRFRSAGFDSGRSQFVGSLDLMEELDRARDAGDADSLWQRLRSNQRWGPTAMEKISAIAAHPMTQVLINAMAHAAGGAMEAHARRAGDRRWGRRR